MITPPKPPFEVQRGQDVFTRFVEMLGALIAWLGHEIHFQAAHAAYIQDQAVQSVLYWLPYVFFGWL